jgi:hypothetical protein
MAQARPRLLQYFKQSGRMSLDTTSTNIGKDNYIRGMHIDCRRNQKASVAVVLPPQSIGTHH